jgi:hypothetical protein
MHSPGFSESTKQLVVHASELADSLDNADDTWAASVLRQLVNEVERLTTALDAAHEARIEAQNPGIDMAEVRATRNAHSGRPSDE